MFRIRLHRGRKGDPKGVREKDFAELLDSAHRELGGPIADHGHPRVEGAILDQGLWR